MHAVGALPDVPEGFPPLPAFEPSAFCRLASGDMAPPALLASFDAPARAVTPQQARPTTY